MGLLYVLLGQSVVCVGVSLLWYRLGRRAGFAQGENRGIHYALSAIRDVLDDDEDDRRTH